MDLEDDVGLELLRPEPPDIKAIWGGKEGLGNLLVTAFGSSLATEDIMGPLKASAMGMQDDLEIALAWAQERRVSHESMRQLIDLEKLPFRRLKQETFHGSVAIHFMPRDNVLRQCYQVIFLGLLRRYIPVKCSFPFYSFASQIYFHLTLPSHPLPSPLTDSTNEVFLEAYPDFIDRPLQEQEYLRQTAEWMYVCFFTLRPFNNKGFLISLIPRLVEGPGCRYVTGSGETLQTSDRVKVFCTEGNFQKIKRGAGGPRKRGRLPNSAIPVETARFRVGVEGAESMAAAVLSALSGGASRSSPRPPSLQDEHEGDQDQGEPQGDGEGQGEGEDEDEDEDQGKDDQDDDATVETNLLQPRYRESKSSRGVFAFPSDQGPPRPTRVVYSVYSSEGTVSSSLGSSFTSADDFSSLTSSGERDANSKFLVLHGGGRMGARGRGGAGGRGRAVSNASTSSSFSDHSSSIVSAGGGAAASGEEEGCEKRSKALAAEANVDVAEQLIRLHCVHLHSEPSPPAASSMATNTDNNVTVAADKASVGSL